MTTPTPTGVFVRLPLSDEDCMTIRKHITSKCLTNDGIVNGLLAIGTPVTGGELEVVGYAPGEDLPLYGDEGIDDTCFTEISLHRQADNDVPLIHQSDALAKLAEKDAEIAKVSAERDGYKDTVEQFLNVLRCPEPMAAHLDPSVPDPIDYARHLREQHNKFADEVVQLRADNKVLQQAIETARGDINRGNPGKAAYVLDVALKGPEA